MSRYGDKNVIARGVILWDGVTRPELSADVLTAYSAAGNSGVKLVPTTATVASRVFRS